jgi:hypothetical protein
MGQRLSMATRFANACYCLVCGIRGAGWRVDQGTGHTVCSLCGKPSPMMVFRDCMWCGDEFVLPRGNPRWKSIMSVRSDGECVRNDFACTTCEPHDE